MRRSDRCSDLGSEWVNISDYSHIGGSTIYIENAQYVHGRRKAGRRRMRLREEFMESTTT